MIPSAAERRLAGWGNFPKTTAPTVDVREPLASLADFREYASLTPRGLGRSYGDASLPAPGGLALQTSTCSDILSFDEQIGRINARAGASLGRIIEQIVPEGWFLPVTPGTRFVTLGGALGSNVHGKNHHRRGAIAHFVRSFSLLAEAGVVECSPLEDLELFRATIGGFGMTGLIQSARVDLIPIRTAWIHTRRIKAVDLDDLLAILASKDVDYEYSITWIDTSTSGAKLGRGVVMLGNHAEVEALPAERRGDALRFQWKREVRAPGLLNGWVLGPWTNRALSRLYYSVMRSRELDGLASLEQWFYPLDAVRDWNRLYGRRGFLQYQFVVPEARGVQAALEHLAKRGACSFVAGLKRMRKDDVLLPFAIDGYTLGIDFGFFQKDLLALLDELDRIVVSQGGRVCLSKDARLSPEMFREMYPEYQHWRDVVRRYAPSGRFSSQMARRLGW